MDKDFDHLLADHLLARERAARGHEEVVRAPARLARAAGPAATASPALAGSPAPPRS